MAVANLPELIEAAEGKPTMMAGMIAEASGAIENRSVALEGMTIRDIGLGLFRKELAIRGDLGGYLKRWLTEAGKDVTALREKLARSSDDSASSRSSLIAALPIHLRPKHLETTQQIQDMTVLKHRSEMALTEPIRTSMCCQQLLDCLDVG